MMNHLFQPLICLKQQRRKIDIDKKKLEEYANLKSNKNKALLYTRPVILTNISYDAIDTIEGKIDLLTEDKFNNVDEYNLYLDLVKGYANSKLNGFDLMIGPFYINDQLARIKDKK